MAKLSGIGQVKKKYLEKLWILQTTEDYPKGYNETVVKTLEWVLKHQGYKLPTLDIVECASVDCHNKFRFRKGKRYCSASCRSRECKRLSSN